jgi:predicted dehydrogenase
MATTVFDTDKRIRLGIWGLGRGAGFARMCKALNIDVVAGCDYVPSMRERFAQAVPGAVVTDSEDELLAADIDAVLLATYCPDHAEHAIKCLEAGKHVLTEVTAFHTPAEGVRLIETVERTGNVFNMAENYPFSKARLYLARKWQEGLFGDLVYGENEYNHDSRRPLSFRYNGGGPIEPGWSLHAWRSWKHQHFYCTHSLGPVMHITGGRPVRVVSLAGSNSMAANVSQVKASGISTVAPSLITMDSGGVVRNFMGSTPNDTHQLRLWGTKGAAEWDGDLVLRLGAKGNAPKFRVEPEWPEFGDLAESMGHGGGDFWVLYYFARHVLFGKPAFWDVYRSAEVTLPGIFAYRSAAENGVAFDIPNFRTKADRDAFRGDERGQKRYDWENGPFPPDADRELLKDFTAVMSALVDTHATGSRAVLDWLSVKNEMADPRELKPVLEQFVGGFDEMRKTFDRAREIAEAYPKSDGAQMLREMLHVAEPERTETPEFLAQVKQELAKL